MEQRGIESLQISNCEALEFFSFLFTDLIFPLRGAFKDNLERIWEDEEEILGWNVFYQPEIILLGEFISSGLC